MIRGVVDRGDSPIGVIVSPLIRCWLDYFRQFAYYFLPQSRRSCGSRNPVKHHADWRDLYDDIVVCLDSCFRRNDKKCGIPNS